MDLSSEKLKHIKRMLLIFEAKRWQNFVESGGDNKGQVVEMFQRAVDGRAVGEPWCMSALQYWVKQVDLMTDAFAQATMGPEHRSKLYSTEHCLTCWNDSDRDCHLSTPVIGTVMIWQKGSTSSGHCGVVVALDKDPDFVLTVEGNTGPRKVVTRQGDGVYLKRRSVHPVGNMRVKGWLNPWP